MLLITIDAMETVRKQLKISGRVQGVGYRYFTQQNARSMNINGWVQNMPDGTVEVLLIGSSEKVQQMIQKLWEGPLPSAFCVLRSAYSNLNT
jgi:acylphosphatase